MLTLREHAIEMNDVISYSRLLPKATHRMIVQQELNLIKFHQFPNPTVTHRKFV